MGAIWVQQDRAHRAEGALTAYGLQDEQAAVRSSAVVAVAECVSALGPRCLPQLGPILETVLQAAEASLAHIPTDATPAAAPKLVCHPAPCMACSLQRCIRLHYHSPFELAGCWAAVPEKGPHES